MENGFENFDDVPLAVLEALTPLSEEQISEFINRARKQITEGIPADNRWAATVMAAAGSGLLDRLRISQEFIDRAISLWDEMAAGNQRLKNMEELNCGEDVLDPLWEEHNAWVRESSKALLRDAEKEFSKRGLVGE